jgi:hypothetical protein
MEEPLLQVFEHTVYIHTVYMQLQCQLLWVVNYSAVYCQSLFLSQVNEMGFKISYIEQVRETYWTKQ